jgi:putative hydrolase of the HAD superfamily
MAVVTDGNLRMQQHKVHALGLASRLDGIFFTARFGPSAQKPSPVAFLAACKALKVRPEEAVYVGDNPIVDCLGPSAIGMPYARLLRGEFVDVTTTECQPALVLDTLDELSEWVTP